MKASNFYQQNKKEIDEKLKESDFKGMPLFLSQSLKVQSLMIIPIKTQIERMRLKVQLRIRKNRFFLVLQLSLRITLTPTPSNLDQDLIQGGWSIYG